MKKERRKINEEIAEIMGVMLRTWKENNELSILWKEFSQKVVIRGNG